MTACSKRTILFKEKRIHHFNKLGYTIKLNGSVINPEFYFLDKGNIKNTVLIKHQRSVLIHQKDTATKYVELAGMVTNVNSTKEIKMVVINGIPFSTDNFNKKKIENNSIKNIQHLKVDSLGIQSCFGQVGDILLIQTN